MTKKLLRGVPPRLKGKIAAAADRRGVSVHGLIVETLAEAFDVDYAAPERKGELGRERTAYPRIILTMPVELGNAIENAAYEGGEPESDVMRRILSEAFKVPFTPGGRWPTAKAS